MLDQKRKRWVDNYTYFFGNLTEEEQMYRDYFQTDIEQNPEDEFIEDFEDELHIAKMGQLNPKLYDFIDYTATHDTHENYDDIVEDKIFKYKYRINGDDAQTFERREGRMRQRMMERAKSRDPVLEQDLDQLFLKDAKENSFGQFVLSPSTYKDVAAELTRPFREYIVSESVQQYKDYYESDEEEQSFFEYLENFTNRDKIRFMEIF